MKYRLLATAAALALAVSIHPALAQQNPPHYERPHQELPAGKLLIARIGDLPPKERLAALADHRARQHHRAMFPGVDGLCAERLDRVAHVVHILGPVERLAEPD